MRLPLLLLLAPCTVPAPPPEPPPAPGCQAELRLVTPDRVEPCQWVWRCAGNGPGGQPIFLPFKSGATEPNCSTAVF